MLGKNTEEVKKNFLSTDEEFMGECEKPGVHIFDVFSSWAGSCEAMSLVLKKLKTENGDLVSFAKVQCDQISDLSIYRNKSRPTFLIYAAGVLVKEVKGANTPLLEKYVKEEVNIEKTGGVHVPLNETEGNRSSIKARTINNRQGSSLKHVFYNEREERTLAILKPDIVSENKVDDVKRYIYKNGFQIVQQQEVLLTPERVAEFFKDHENQPYFQSLGTSICYDFVKGKCCECLEDVKGNSLRGMFGTDTVRNAIHGSKSEEAAKREVKFFFPEDISPIQRTLAIIKPDLVQSGKAAEVVDYIKDHDFKIITMEQVQFTEESATGFYITHRNAPYFANLINWLSSGPVLAMVLEKENAVKEWRDCIGPTNPAMAKELAPEW
ncbi:nucleoside diphosphate kinase [Rozella allomycis CSF55]|uniref:Nucleoside diphosphate kinase n=1 Tax=Rozella allomycis (strain CSF55) TaxID=988480 RepID=A0A075AYV3_ROZAC|nr:Nucleoside diphosphate kinase domain-containing protein [Rozella allomycis CSF55]RKP19482.1 nucleoside diphosphate kinase [Rozella allomycis CSF55]|eukprot:EPZ33724.1 Nucleoside diphosphate kinase domain-containing protein [Rozella allomycis CSF55]